METSVRKNYLFSTTVQIYTLFTLIAITPYISRKLGPEGVGLNSYISTIVSYVIMFGTLKSDFFGSREFIYEGKTRESFWSIYFLRLISMSLAIVLYLIYAIKSSIKLYLFLSLPAIISAIIDVGWVYIATENFKFLSLREFIVRTISFVPVFFLIKSKQDVGKLIALSAFSLFIGNLIFFLDIFRKYTPPVFEIKRILFLFPKAMKMFLPELSISIYALLDKIMLGILSTKEELGYYEIASNLPSLILALFSSMTSVMMPRMSNLLKENNHDKFEKSVLDSFKFSFILSSFMIILVLSVSKELVPWFFGAQYIKSVNALNVRVFIVACVALGVVAGHQSLVSLKKENYLTISVTIGAITNFLLNWKLIPKQGAYGASIASLVAESLVTISLYIFLSRFINIKIIFRGVINIIPAIVITYILSYLLVKIKIWWGLRAFLISTVYFTICAFFDKDVKFEIIKTIRDIRKIFKI